MSSHANLKHATTEPAHVTGKGENANSSSNKREGRRAAGRAAALRGASDSDCSGETASLSADSGELQNNLTTIVSQPTVVTQPRSKHAKNRSRRRGSEWEVLEGLKDGQRFERRPEVFNGYLHKKRKWPLKGWHKRYFVVDGGILVYARSPGDVARGRLHGSVDVGLSVISAKARRRRIDIDADEFIYHLRAKTAEAFQSWLNVLKVHRLYRQHLLTFGVRESIPRINVADDNQRPESISRLGSPSSGNIRAPQAGFVSGTPGGRLASWIIESGGPLENASRELGQAQLSVQQLQRLLDCLEQQQQLHHDTDVSLDGASPSVKKDRRKFGLRKKKSASSKGGSVDLHLDSSFSHAALSALTAPPSPGGGAPSLSAAAASLPIAFLSTYLASAFDSCSAARPQSLPGADALGGCGAPTSLNSLTPDHQLREDFTILAKDLVSTLKGVVSTLVCERARLRAAVETAESPPAQAALRASLAAAVHQNTELKNRLSRIHDTSDLTEVSSVGPASEMASRQFQASLSYSSSCVSASEFFDAEEHEGESDQAQPALPSASAQLPTHAQDGCGVIELEGDTSSEAGSLSSEEGSVSSDNSDAPLMAVLAGAVAGGEVSSGRRARLPCPRPNPAGPSLWNLLYKNIGKDLSQISMPVTINEPLNMLQRLCEELEYSELLDAAAECAGGAERAALVAAFAVSAYASSAHRAASKPFNPLLAETYECVRQDRGFRFISEQVSHHPPVSVCHAESPRWTFWQEARIRTKFWGKSMEFQPAGRVHVRLHATGEHYTWNKVTTCVHNLFGGQRWVDQYGDMHITSNASYSCKLNFIKASSWSTSRHEVRGAVTEGGVRPTRITGRWSEALYAGDPPAARCLWRHGAMPPEHELYYGFTRFAMELNELESGLKEKLPGTDTRLRPDQRALEEGDVDTAESLKLKLEQAQRERRRRQPYHTPRWFRKEVENGEEVWVFGGEYWKAREAGFPNEPDPVLW